MSATDWLTLLGRPTVSKLGFGGTVLRFHPSHDMGSLFCRRCDAWGTDRRKALRPCPAPRENGVGL